MSTSAIAISSSHERVCAMSCRRLAPGPADRRAAGRDLRRRRQPERGDPVRRSTAGSDRAERIGTAVAEGDAEQPGWSTSTRRSTSASPSCRSDIDRPKAADLGVQLVRCRRCAAAARRRRPGDDLQRRRRAVRSPHAGAGAENRSTAAGIGRSDVPSSRAGERAAREHGAVRRRARRRRRSTA